MDPLFGKSHSIQNVWMVIQFTIVRIRLRWVECKGGVMDPLKSLRSWLGHLGGTRKPRSRNTRVKMALKIGDRRKESIMSFFPTWGRLALICLWRESRSFSTSASFISVSPKRSWVSRRLSINLSLSSNIETMSCSKLASSPENWELLWLMLSSDIVGITSHIIFHILPKFSRNAPSRN